MTNVDMFGNNAESNDRGALGLARDSGRLRLRVHGAARGSVRVRHRDRRRLQLADRGDLVACLVLLQGAAFQQRIRVVCREQIASGPRNGWAAMRASRSERTFGACS